jgi:trehalose 6-phosphate synthase/phosphatase
MFVITFVNSSAQGQLYVMNKIPFVIVANRLPVSVSKVDGKLQFTPSNGGLATAMSSLKTDNSKMWIGWPGIASDDLTTAEKRQITNKLRQYDCYPVFLSHQQVQNFYEGYANDTIWPLFHYFQSVAKFEQTYWQAYSSVNKLYANAVLRWAEPAAKIWIHDYHLMLLPDLLRGKLPDSAIGFFLHIPFPSYEIFRLLPERREILQGLLGSDLIGFHTYDYARHFSSSVLRLLGLESRHGTIRVGQRLVSVDAFPIGIDYQKFVAATKSPAVKDELTTLDHHYDGQRVILSMDRLDYSKGIANRLEAFEQLLRNYPQYHKKVALVMVAVPSRIEVIAYKELRDEIEQTVSRINGMYATVDWTPISYQFKNLPFTQIVSLFAKADIALITPLRDGMNLVAKEYVASKQKRPGVLILSEMTGAVDELPEALRINPNDTATIVRAIRQALRMPAAEQRKRMRLMQRRLSQYSVQRWGNDFIEQLEASKRKQGELSRKYLQAQDKNEIINAFRQADRRLFLLDYDGTLADFVNTPDPAYAKPSRTLLKVLADLANLRHTEVCIISGRTRDALQSWFGKLPLTLVAEHGAWVKERGEWSQQELSFQEQKEMLRPILERYAERTPGAHIEEKTFALVWHYDNVAPDLAYDRTANLRHELLTLVDTTEVGVYSGHKIIEIKPRSIHKGTVADELLASSQADFVLCGGDDYTDEDMFKALPESAYTINVGRKETHARFQLETVRQMVDLLQKLSTAK